MIWSLLLAHFLGDYLLQTDWMVRRKNSFWVLLIHSGIHFAVMVVFTWQLRLVVWPYLLLIAAAHLVQDSIKLLLTNLKQRARVLFYLLDQLIHYLIIWGVVTWFQARHDSTMGVEAAQWVILALVYLVITHVWFISERIFYLQKKDYLESINETKLSRMLSRAVLLSLFLLVGRWAFPGVVLLMSAPYPSSKHQKRAIVTDLLVSFLGFLFLALAPF